MDQKIILYFSENPRLKELNSSASRAGMAKLPSLARGMLSHGFQKFFSVLFKIRYVRHTVYQDLFTKPKIFEALQQEI